MKRLILLAVDPGPSWTGHAILDVLYDPGVRVTFLDGGHAPSTLATFEGLLGKARAHAMQPATAQVATAPVVVPLPLEVCVAIETPAGFAFGPGRVPMLLATALPAGGMDWVAQLLGHRVVKATAQQVRKVLAGKSNADDAIVKQTVQGLVFGAPQTSNDHINDALAMGVLGAWILVGQVVLPEVPSGKGKRRAKGKVRAGVAGAPASAGDAGGAVGKPARPRRAVRRIG